MRGRQIGSDRGPCGEAAPAFAPPLPLRWLLLSLLLRARFPFLRSPLEYARIAVAASQGSEFVRTWLYRQARRLIVSLRCRLPARPLAFALFLLCLPANPKNSGPKAAAISVVYAGVFAYMYFKAEDITVSGRARRRRAVARLRRGMGWLRAAWLLLAQRPPSLLHAMDARPFSMIHACGCSCS